MLVEKACNDKCYPPAKLYPNDFNEKSVLKKQMKSIFNIFNNQKKIYSTINISVLVLIQTTQKYYQVAKLIILYKLSQTI